MMSIDRRYHRPMICSRKREKGGKFKTISRMGCYKSEEGQYGADGRSAGLIERFEQIWSFLGAFDVLMVT